jgi:hypothetical protein
MKTAEKTPTKRDRAIQYFIDNFIVSRTDFLNHIIFEYNNNNGFPCVAIFGERGFRPECNYRFKNEGEACAFTIEQKASIQRRHDQEQERLNKYAKEKEGFKAGEILVSSWGHEQTNIDFYLILERKNDFVLLQEIGQSKSLDTRYGDRGETTADKTTIIGEPFKKKISKFASVQLASYKYCGLWDGKPEYWSGYA